MRLFAVYHKGDEIAFISHLDIQRALQRAFRRANVPLAYSQGFNPHPKLSFASAVATGQTSDAEWFEVALEERIDPGEFTARVNAVMPPGLSLSDAFEPPDNFPSLSSLTRAAEYVIKLSLVEELPADRLSAAAEALLNGAIIVQKRTKGGEKAVDIRPQIIGVFVEKIEGKEITLRVLGRLQADGGLRAELFAGALLDRLDAHGSVAVRRTHMYFAGDGPLPQLP